MDRFINEAELGFDGANTDKEQSVFAGLDWQVSDSIALGFEGRFYEEDVTTDVVAGGKTGEDLSETFDGLIWSSGA